MRLFSRRISFFFSKVFLKSINSVKIHNLSRHIYFEDPIPEAEFPSSKMCSILDYMNQDVIGIKKLPNADLKISTFQLENLYEEGCFFTAYTGIDRFYKCHVYESYGGSLGDIDKDCKEFIRKSVVRIKRNANAFRKEACSLLRHNPYMPNLWRNSKAVAIATSEGDLLPCFEFDSVPYSLKENCSLLYVLIFNIIGGLLYIVFLIFASIIATIADSVIVVVSYPSTCCKGHKTSEDEQNWFDSIIHNADNKRLDPENIDHFIFEEMEKLACELNEKYSNKHFFAVQDKLIITKTVVPSGEDGGESYSFDISYDLFEIRTTPSTDIETGAVNDTLHFECYDYEDVNLAVPNGKQIRIIQANYSSPGNHNDFTQKFQEFVKGRESFSHTGGIHLLLGDPEFEVPKVFSVDYCPEDIDI